MPRLSEETIAQIKLAHPLEDAIGKRVKLGRANAKGVCSGACLCEPVRGKSPLWVNVEKGTFGCLKPNGCGGDLFAYLEQFEGLDFAAAIRALGGADVERDDAALAQMKASRDAAKAERQAREAALDERERKRAYEIWQAGVPSAGTLVDAYFVHRGLTPLASPALRFSADEAFYVAGDERPIVVHRGPCMLAAIQAPDGKFCGVHRTWLDARLGTPDMDAAANGKAKIPRPDGVPADVKKMRGLKKRGAIRLCSPDTSADDRALIIGEGIETTATALEALCKYGRPGVDYSAWAAGDLGNMSGAGLGPSTRHPTRPGLWVPPSEPDMSEPGVLPPAWASRVILLGDGDSDGITTSARLACAKARFERLGFPTTIRMAPADKDFNDLARSAS